jgi:hypothetical protein
MLQYAWGLPRTDLLLAQTPTSQDKYESYLAKQLSVAPPVQADRRGAFESRPRSRVAPRPETSLQPIATLCHSQPPVADPAAGLRADDKLRRRVVQEPLKSGPADSQRLVKQIDATTITRQVERDQMRRVPTGNSRQRRRSDGAAIERSCTGRVGSL